MNPFTLVSLLGIKTGNSVWFRGAAIQEQGKPYNRGFNTTIGNFTSVIRSYFSNPISDKEIQLVDGDNRFKVKTDKKGNFELELPSDQADKLVSVYKDFDYPILFEETKADFIVISDIDDTILHSYIKSPLKRMLKLLTVKGQKRKVIEPTEEAFRYLGEDGVRWFYVSRSESNLFPIISRFIVSNSLPQGPIFLRSFTRGINLLKSGREKAFKEIWIQWIADKTKEPKMIFFGDDSQHDLQVFTDFAKSTESRVRAIFIRKTGHQNKKLNDLETLPNTFFYEDFTDIEETLKNLKDEITVRS